MGILATFLTVPARLGAAARSNGIRRAVQARLTEPERFRRAVQARLTEPERFRVSHQLVESAQSDPQTIFQQLNTGLSGLTTEEAEARLKQSGANVIAREKRLGFFDRLWQNIKNPLVILLTILGIVSYLTEDVRAATVIGLMVLLGIVLRFVQEARADHAAEKLQAMVSTTATVIRDGIRQEIPLKEIVPGDIVHLSAGDMVPADVRVLSAKELTSFDKGTNKIPFIQSRASKALILTSLLIVAFGAFLPFSPLASTLGFVALPPSYWLYLAGMLISYVVLTQVVKTWFIKRFGE